VKRRLVKIRKDYPHHEALRGQVGVLRRNYDDGTVLVHFEDGPHQGDKVCMDGRYVEALS